MLSGKSIARVDVDADRRNYRMLNVLDEFTDECLEIRVARKLKAIDQASSAESVRARLCRVVACATPKRRRPRW